MPRSSRLRPPLKTHGGKYYLAPRIVRLFDDLPHTDYLEPFGGGGSVLLAREPGMFEQYNDLDYRLYLVMRTVRDNVEKLLKLIEPVDYSQEVFDATAFVETAPEHELRTLDPVPLAAACLARNRMSRGGMWKAFAWSERLRGGRPGDANAWLMAKAQLRWLSERLRSVAITNVTALDVIRKAKASTLIYADPPYVPKTRTAPKVYRREMVAAEHVELLTALELHPGPVVLSGYDCELYRAALDSTSRWSRVEWEIANHSGQTATKQRRREVVWIKATSQNGGAR